jgi:hypothetical protein
LYFYITSASVLLVSLRESVVATTYRGVVGAKRVPKVCRRPVGACRSSYKNFILIVNNWASAAATLPYALLRGKGDVRGSDCSKPLYNIISPNTTQ